MVALAHFQNVSVPTPGFGIMSLSGAYGSASDNEGLKVLAKAVELGCTFWDTAAVYGMGKNEELVGRFFQANPEARSKVFLGSKCGFEMDFEKGTRVGVCNTAEHIRSYLADSTRRLGSAPDLYYLHRRDPKIPLEESVGTLAALKAEGKVKYIGLSEVSPETLRAACKVAHIDALQIEYSAFSVDYEQNGLIDTARELGVTVVAFSPLGAGFLTGKYSDPAAFNGDMRSQAGRFAPENMKTNLRLLEKLQTIASRKSCTPGQLALAWVAAQGAIPIPGTKSISRLEENFGATDVTLSDEELKEIREIINTNPAVGSRWSEGTLAMSNK